jgi:cytochrome c-type biogenesis protein CcmH
MLTFWIIATVLILFALALVVPPFFKKLPPSTADIDSNRVNVAIYKERLAELEQEQLTPEQREIAKQELEKTLLQDLRDQSPPQSQPRARWASVVVVFSLPILAVGGYLKLGSPQFIAPAEDTQATCPTKERLPPNFKEMLENLATRLEKQSEDEKSWQMLSRGYVSLCDYPKVIQTYNKRLAKFGEQPEVMIELAEFIAKSNEGQLAGLPTVLLKTVLNTHPNSQDALWLLGFAAVQKEEFNAAIDYWQRLLAQLPASDVEARQNVEKNLAEVRRQIAQSKTFPSASSTATSTIKVPENASSTAVDSTNVAKIEVTVSLDPALQEKVKPEDTLFVYARATQGPPMPVAIVKKLAKDLPISVTLEDSLAMMPTMKLSNFKEVLVLARISHSGDATPKPGDLQGQSETVLVGTQSKVEIKINQVVQ